MSNFDNIILKAVRARAEALKNANMPENARVSQLKQLQPCEALLTNALVKVARDRMTQTDFKALAQVIAQCDEFGKGVEQVKVVVKIVDVMRNVAQGMKAKSNNFNLCVQGMLKNKGAATRTDMVCMQSAKAREVKGSKTSEGLTARSGSYSIGTADSQSSQVMQVLRLMGFADAQKGVKDKPAVLNDYGREVLAAAYATLAE